MDLDGRQTGERRLAGFLINPVAGMGGAVGLKGTDGLSEQALALGAVPVSPGRAMEALRSIARVSTHAAFITAAGEMGEDALRESGLDFEVVYTAPGLPGADDTKAACSEFRRRGAHLILFVGGDGTARDVASVAGDTPVLGVPAGVKMHSGVFAVSPEAAGELTVRFLRGELFTRETEIADVDEELYRAGVLQTQLYGIARTPYAPALVQERKQVYASGNEEWAKREIAEFAAEFMRDGSAYIVGAGTTTSRIAQLMGLEKTLLGVDVIRDGRMVIRDANERDLITLLDDLDSESRMTGESVRARIIVSPIGAQGFILGRGSQQISASVVRRAGPDSLIIIATPHKLRELETLLVDTGDADLDRTISGRRQVLVGYRLAQAKSVKAAGDVGHRI